MEATTPETYAVLDGAYWLDAADGDRTACVHCALLRRGPAPGPSGEPGRGEATGREARAATDADAGGGGDDAGQEGLLDRLRTAITCGNPSTLRAVMLTCSVGTVIVGAAATLRR